MEDLNPNTAGQENSDEDNLHSSAEEHQAYLPGPDRSASGSADPEAPLNKSKEGFDGTTMDQISADELDRFQKAMDAIRDEIGKVIVGQEKAVDLLITGLLSGGHVLLEGVPGIAKTLTAKLLSRSLSLDFSRIQFTPDLMPSDVIGTSVFNMQSSEFQFKRGPVFANIVLIDEINRSPAKTQAALFEVMEEQQITHDGVRYLLEAPFMVIATQNPIEQEGTYRLPEAQLDRFLFRIRMEYPKLAEERTILRRFKDDFDGQKGADITEVMNGPEILALRKTVEKVYIKDALCDYIADLVHATRNTGSLYLGASPRASLAILRTSKAYALIAGRSFVTPDDIQTMCYPVMNHRILLSSERELEGAETEQVIKEIIQTIEVPR